MFLLALALNLKLIFIIKATNFLTIFDDVLFQYGITDLNLSSLEWLVIFKFICSLCTICNLTT